MFDELQYPTAPEQVSMSVMTQPKKKKVAAADTPQGRPSISVDPETLEQLRDYCERAGRSNPLFKNSFRAIASVAIREYIHNHPIPDA